MALYIWFIGASTFFTTCVSAAPMESKQEGDTALRQQKSFPFYDYYGSQEIDYGYDVNNDDFLTDDLDENEISSRTLPARKRYNARPQYNSPIYYIRMPPQPYMFVPNIGYVSQPPAHPLNQFLNVPVSFIANGKPSSIYQWSGTFDQYPDPSPPQHHPVTTPKPKPVKVDSNTHRLKGPFNFNGKPENIYILEESYNSLYNDALQNFYP